MILVDNTQVLMSSIFAQQRDISAIDEHLVRHMVLNTYRMYRKKFFREYGELVICQDGGASWRREFFPLYKAKRRADRKENPEQWDHFYDIINRIRAEVAETFPYRNVLVQGCEADDIIAFLSKRYAPTEKILILSGDKDFGQLHIYQNVSQYSPLLKKFITVENPKQYLLEHIVKGDSSDGVPNVLSDDDSFVNEDKRQKPVTKKRMDELLGFYAETGNIQTKYAANWNRNKTLIDLLHIPAEYEAKIETEWNKPFTPSRAKILNYMIEKGLRNLIEDIGDF
jgi:5'-3' exonuclease